MKLMGIPGLTLYHLKSHLQKYRLSKHMHGQNSNVTHKISAATGERLSENNGTHVNNLNPGGPQSNKKDLHISEALQMQIEVQRRLNEQLEVQRLLQLRTEAQGKYLQAVLEKAQETLGRQNLGIVGLEAAKVQLSELVSKVSSQCLNSSFSELKEELQGFSPKEQTQTNNQPNDCSMDSSCLTSCDGSQKEQDIIDMSLRPFNGHTFMEPKDVIEAPNPNLRNSDIKWCDDPVKKKYTFLTPMGKNAETDNESSMYPKKIMIMGRQLDGEFQQPNTTVMEESMTKPMAEKKVSQDYRLPSYFAATKLDLRRTEDNDAAAAGCKQLDLNGFSWS